MSQLSTLNLRFYFENCACDPALLRDPDLSRRKLLGVFRRAGLEPSGGCSTGGRGETVTVLLLPGLHLLLHAFYGQGAGVLVEISGRHAALGECQVETLRGLLEELYRPSSRLSEAGSGPALAERTMEENADLNLPGTLPVERVLEASQSQYQYIQIIDTPGFGRVLVLDDVFQTSEKDEFLYHEPLVQVPMLAHPEPRKVLVIGGGDGGSAEEVLKHPGVRHCDLVEMDGEVVRLSRRHLETVHRGVFGHPRLRLIIGDGVRFVAESVEAYDVICLDLTDPDPQSGGLYTPDFFRSIRRVLAEGGLLTLHLGTANASPLHARQCLSGLREIFPGTRVYCNYVPLYAGLMIFCLAGDLPALPTTGELEERIRERDVKDLRCLNETTYPALFALPPYLLDLLGI